MEKHKPKSLKELKIIRTPVRNANIIAKQKFLFHIFEVTYLGQK
jgi:hypothetical protein